MPTNPKRRWTCAKCSSKDIAVKWHYSRFDCGTSGARTYSEHLHFYCKRCNYDWTGATDAKAKSKFKSRIAWAIIKRNGQIAFKQSPSNQLSVYDNEDSAELDKDPSEHIKCVRIVADEEKCK